MRGKINWDKAVFRKSMDAYPTTAYKYVMTDVGTEYRLQLPNMTQMKLFGYNIILSTYVFNKFSSCLKTKDLKLLNN